MSDFVHQPMLTYIGNKRKIVSKIGDLVTNLKTKLGKEKLRILDAFTGSGVVARALSQHAEVLHMNDLEYYSWISSKCYLDKPSPEDQGRIRAHITEMNRLAEEGPWVEGIMCEHYAPKDTENIQMGERCFYTRENALRLDTMRRYVEEHVEEHLEPYTIGPMLVRASQNSNSAGLFRAFYKDREGRGKWGGQAGGNLGRILKPIVLEQPIWSSEDYKAFCHQMDVVELVRRLPDDSLDVIYLDPPYNQHSYAANYFILNIIAENDVDPTNITPGSGVPKDWNRSEFCSSRTARNAFEELLTLCLRKAPHVILSYNNEGIVKPNEWDEIFGDVQVIRHDIIHPRYRGRNSTEYDKNVTEFLFQLNRN